MVAHSVTMRDKVLDAILERVRGRAGLKALALEIEGFISDLRKCEAVEWEPELGGKDRLWDLMDEKVAAFRMRTPSMKSLDPLWRARGFAYERAEVTFRAAATDFERHDGVTDPDRARWEPIIRQVWMSRDFSGDTRPTPPEVLAAHEPRLTAELITAVMGARTFRGMALQLAYAAWGTSAQNIEDFRKKLERIVARLSPHQ